MASTALARGRRARKDEDKEGRRRQLLDAAVRLFARLGYADVKMADVADAAGLAKGTVFLYFPTKEALFLALLEEELFAWFAALDATLQGEGGRWSGPRVARLVATSAAERDVLTRLLTLWQTVLEYNVTADQVRPFKVRLLAQLGRTGALLEGRLPFLAAGEGAQLLLHIAAIVTGLRQMADVAPAVREVFDAEPARFAPLAVDFGAELARVLTHQLRGLEAR